MMELRPVGVGGVLAVLGNAIRSETGAQVAALREAVEHAHICGLEETVPAYASLLVKYDPFLTDYDALCGTLRALERQISASTVTEGKIVEIPVCYGGAYGEDLPLVARHAGMTEQEVVALHSGQPYRIYMLGFLPGFPYLGGLDERLHTPRLSTPRTRIPAGSVGEALSVPMQQTARYVRDFGYDVTDDEKAVINEVLDYDSLAQSYMPELSDGVKQYYKNPSKGGLARYMLTWAKMFFKHPVCYFEALHANSHGYYTITKCRAINDYYTFNNDTCMQMFEMDVHYLDKSGYLRYAFVQALSAFEKLPLVGLITSIGFMAWLTAVLGVWLARRKAKQTLPIFMGLGIFWLTCIASPVNDCMRYFLPIAGCLPLIFCLALYFCKKNAEKSA